MEEMVYKVEFRHVEPDIEPVDIDGVHLILTGTKAFFFHLFRTMKSEKEAIEILYPYLLDDIQRAKMRRTASMGVEAVPGVKTPCEYERIIP